MKFKKYLLLIAVLAGLLPFPVLATGPDGDALFKSNCATCHRDSGQGGIGLPLKKNKIKFLTNNYLNKTIRHGRPGRIMPAFETLSDAQVNAIVQYLRDWSGSDARIEKEVRISGDSVKGKKLFSGYCANCHGTAGKGLGKGTGKSYSRERDFDVIPPAISNTGFLASASDAMLKDVITNGRQGTLMASFGKLGLSEQDINDIIVYLRTVGAASLQVDREHEGFLPDPSIIVDSPYDFDTTLKNLKQALSGYNFRIFPDRYLEQGMFPEWDINRKQITVRYCNFNQLYDMLRTDPRLGIGLPCRITVVEHDDGRVQLIAMNMALIARLFNNDQLQGRAQELNNLQMEIIEEVTF